MFTNIAVVAQDGAGLELIRSSIRNPLRYTVREFLTLDQVNHSLFNFSFDILIARYPRVDARFVSLVMALRARFLKQFLIIISPHIEPAVRYQLRDLPKVVLLHESFENRDLTQIIETAAKGTSHPSRLHARSPRQETASLIYAESGETIRARLLDIAQMGARVLAQPTVVIEKNRRLQLRYHSRAEPGRIHRIEAKVVWAEVSAGFVSLLFNGPEQQLGLRFVAVL